MAQQQVHTRLGFAQLLEIVARRINVELRVCLPVRVLEYIPHAAGARPTPPRVRVRCDLLAAVYGDPDEAQQGEAYLEPVEPGEGGLILRELAGGSFIVPVHFPGTWGGWSRGEILKGELGKLVFADRSLDTWQVDGGVGDPFDPYYEFFHGANLCDAWFEPGTRSGRSMSAAEPGPSTVPAGASAWGLADGTATLEVRHPTGDPTTQRNIALKTTGPRLELDAAAKIVAGDPAAAVPLAKAAATEANLDALLTALQTIPPTGVPAADTALGAIKTAALAVQQSLVPTATSKLEGQ